MPKILFVCTGNTCRSPMAEHIFNKLVEEDDNLTDWKAISGGISVFSGQSATNYTSTVLAEEGIDLFTHRSKQLTEDIVKEVDLILTMTKKHKEYLKNTYPNEKDKVFTVKEFARKGSEDFTLENTQKESISIDDNLDYDLDIMDPFGQSEKIYRETKNEIKEELEKVIGKLNHFNFQAGKSIKKANNITRGDTVKIAIGSDHAGYDLKLEILKYLKEAGYEYEDMGTNSSESVDYPDYGFEVAQAVATGECERGILVCGTGIGMSIAANKVKGIRAALCHDVFSAKATRNHNNSNVLTIGSRVVGNGLALEIVKTWLGEDFAGGRHQNRIDKITKIERGDY